jgi:hypothetical protein
MMYPLMLRRVCGFSMTAPPPPKHFKLGVHQDEQPFPGHWDQPGSLIIWRPCSPDLSSTWFFLIGMHQRRCLCYASTRSLTISIASWQLQQILGTNLHKWFLSGPPSVIAVKHAFELEEVTLRSSCKEIYRTVCEFPLYNQTFVLTQCKIQNEKS